MPYTSIPDVNRHTKEIVTIDAPFPLMSYSSKISGSKRAKTKQMRNTTPRNAEIPHWMKPTTRPKLSRLQQKAFLRSSPSIIADYSLDLPKIIRKDYQQRRISNDSTMRNDDTLKTYSAQAYAQSLYTSSADTHPCAKVAPNVRPASATLVFIFQLIRCRSTADKHAAKTFCSHWKYCSLRKTMFWFC